MDEIHGTVNGLGICTRIDGAPQDIAYIDDSSIDQVEPNGPPMIRGGQHTVDSDSIFDLNSDEVIDDESIVVVSGKSGDSVVPSSDTTSNVGSPQVGMSSERIPNHLEDLEQKSFDRRVTNELFDALDSDNNLADEYIVVSSMQQRWDKFLNSLGKDHSQQMDTETTTIAITSSSFDNDDDDNIITVVSPTKPIIDTSLAPSIIEDNSNGWRVFGWTPFGSDSSWSSTPSIFVTFMLGLLIAICSTYLYIIRNTTRRRVASIPPLSPSQSTKNTESNAEDSRQPSPISSLSINSTTAGLVEPSLCVEAVPSEGTGKDQMVHNDNKSDNLDEASAALALLSLSEETNATSTPTSQAGNPSYKETTNGYEIQQNLTNRRTPDGSHNNQNLYSSKKHLLEGKASREESEQESSKRFKLGCRREGNQGVTDKSATTGSLAATNDGGMEDENFMLAATIKDTQQVLLQCGQDPSLAPIVALFRHERHEMMKSQREFEHGRRIWDDQQRQMERQHSLHQQKETIEALLNNGSSGGGKTWQQEHDDRKRLKEMRNQCWSSVTRLLIEIILVHRLANHLGLLILRRWQKIQQQGGMLGDDPLSRAGWWLSTLAELVSKAFNVTAGGFHFSSFLRLFPSFLGQQACSQCSSTALDISTNEIELIEPTSPSGSYFDAIMYYATPSSALEIVLGLVDPIVSSSVCYGTCVLRWIGLVLGILIIHSVLRVFSVPTAVHNGVNAVGAYWIFLILSPPPALQEPQPAMWQWAILGASISLLYGMVQWQYWCCQRLLGCTSNRDKATPNNDKTSQKLRLSLRRMNQLHERIQFVRFALIVLTTVFWWFYYNRIFSTQKPLSATT